MVDIAFCYIYVKLAQKYILTLYIKKEFCQMSANFEYYKIFYYVAKYQNLTQAADALMSSQPAITRSIKNLENELGCRLFVRSSHGVSLTKEGELLYKHVTPACELLFKGEEDLNTVLGLKEGQLYIGATETALHCYLLDKLEKFHHLYPGVHIKISNQTTPTTFHDFKSGKIDLALVTTPCNYTEPFRLTPVKTFNDVLVGNRDYAHMARQTWHLAELSKYPLVSLSRDTMSYQFIQKLYAAYQVPLRLDIELASAHLILPLIRHGLGIGFIPEEMAQPALDSGELVKINLYERIPPRQICYVRDASRSMNAATRKLLELMPGEPELKF